MFDRVRCVLVCMDVKLDIMNKRYRGSERLHITTYSGEREGVVIEGGGLVWVFSEFFV